MQIIVPMSGFGDRFRQAGYTTPKPLIEIEGKPIIAHVIDMFPGETHFLFICNEEHLREPSFQIKEILNRYCPTGKVIGISSHKRGPVHAVLQAEKEVDRSGPVIVNYCDFSCYWHWNHFISYVKTTRCDGAIPAYKGFHPHSLGNTNYAYLKEYQGWVQDIQEKRPFTENRLEEYASSGTYYFSSGALMLEACRTVIADELQVGGEYYISMAYKHLLENRCKVAIYELQHFMQWGTPEDLEEYSMWSNAFRQLVDPAYASHLTVGGATLVPMAGLGERFRQAGYTTPKPLISVSGKPMVVQATSDLPKTARHVFVLRRDMAGSKEVAEILKAQFPNAHSILLDGPTDGQARTAFLGWDIAYRNTLDDETVTIAACDNGMLYRNSRLMDILDDPATDVIVWVAKKYPNAVRYPHMYGWVDIDDTSGVVRNVSVKNPLNHPAQDAIITGTFTFRRALYFRQVITRMIDRNARVNGEFYLDVAIEDALALGLRVRAFAIDSYIGWGTPTELQTFQYWQSCFHKWSTHPYRLEHDLHVAGEARTMLSERYAERCPALPESCALDRRAA
ncbi:MAG: NTP transferase domain-containing protein [Nitrospira sp.]